jgi:hypothetical protein
VIIDCDSCQVRGLACGDCVVTFLLGVAPLGVELDETEQAALSVLADQGLVPPLRLVPAAGSDTGCDAGCDAGAGRTSGRTGRSAGGRRRNPGSARSAVS